MIKSNINIASNVYIRHTDAAKCVIIQESLKKDPEFSKQIRGEKFLKELKEYSKSFQYGINLTDVQQNELQQGLNCVKNKSGEREYGRAKLEDGDIIYECRCENIDCEKYNSECKPKKYNRTALTLSNDNLCEDQTDSLNWQENWYNHSDLLENTAEDCTPKDFTVDVKNFVKDTSEFEQITAEEAIDKIIKSDINSHIFVNAGPGTGKTYTVIQRLLYLLNEVEQCENILTLCYTKAAIGEIKKRINIGIEKGELPYNASKVSICTFDSLATSYLVQKGIDAKTLNTLDYNQRIKKFNNIIEKDDFNNFQYCIVDELQDLVNDRATMTLKLLDALNCGYMILGDKCQAIYDYDCKSGDSINSEKFYAELNKKLCDDIQKYELIGNKRQSSPLCYETEKLRFELLNFDSTRCKNTYKNSINNLPVYTKKTNDFRGSENKGTTAILCRNNGEAEYLSCLLYKNNVPHNLIRSNIKNEHINRYIADTLWDYCNETISKPELTKRLMVRCRKTTENANYIFDRLCELIDQEEEDFIKCNTIAKALIYKSDISKEILCENDFDLTVSTVHKAKGREFDNIYMLGYDYRPNFKKPNNTEEERIIYVAQTRAKNNLSVLKKSNPYDWFFKKCSNERWIQTGSKNYKYICRGCVVGLTDDVDYLSFVSGNLQEAVNNQKYMSINVKPGDNIKLTLNNGIYDIIHSSHVIGKMSKQFSDELKQCDYIYHLPDEISELFVKDVFTYVSYNESEEVPLIFRKNGLWLAVEITGFGKTNWKDKQ